MQMEQVIKFPGKVSGAHGSELVDGHSLALEAWGEQAKDREGGMRAFAYLWRRFGPPFAGSDEHKDLAAYDLTTADPEVFLWLTPSGSSLVYAVGYFVTEAVAEEYRRPRNEYLEQFQAWVLEQNPGVTGAAAGRLLWSWSSSRARQQQAEAVLGRIPPRPNPEKWREDTGIIRRVNQALFDALRELRRPVFVRDAAMNILGRVADDSPLHAEFPEAAERSKYAGYPVPWEAMDALLTAE